ncbi:MAG: TspO/MBR family protein [Actinomycetes bacterium]
MDKELKIVLTAIGLAIVVAYASGSGFWVNSGNDWYQALKKPSFQPPDWVFGTMWTYNFAILGIVIIYIVQRLIQVQVVTFLVFFVLSVASALFWSYVFYSRHDLITSTLFLGLAAVLTIPLVILSFRASKVLGFLILPYQTWLIVATTLSIGYAINN